MKKFILILAIIFFPLCANSQIISGGVEYNSETAQQEMINSKPAKFDKNLIKTNLLDKNHNENITTLLQGNTELKDRTLALFSDGSYGIIYKNDKQNVWYYNNQGVLTHNEIKTSLTYPYKTYKYSTNGTLVNMSLRISDTESYVFDNSGKLLAHWVGNYCYDSSGNIIMTRKIMK